MIAGDVAEHGFSSLKAPIVQVTALDATVPYSEPLEAYVHARTRTRSSTPCSRCSGTAPVAA